MNYGEIAKDRGNLAQAYCIQDKHRSEVCPTLHLNNKDRFFAQLVGSSSHVVAH